MNKEYKRDSICLFTNSKFMGIEFKYDCYLAYAGQKEPLFHIQITLGWIRFWWIRFKK